MTSHNEPSSQVLLDVHQVSELISVSAHGVRHMVARRQIPHIRIGNRVRFDPNELHQWIEQHRVPAS